jgi:DNA-binding CsgD family transcriptional regulator
MLSSNDVLPIVRVANALKPITREIDALDLLDRTVAPKVSVSAAWRWPMQAQEAGKQVFFHHSVPAGFQEEYRVAVERHGPSLIGRTLWREPIPLTLHELVRAQKPSAADRWIFDLIHKHGRQDAFYCPFGPWIIIYDSPRILDLSSDTRVLLYTAAGLVACRLEQFMRRRRRAGSRVRLSPQELAVLRQLSLGNRLAEIAGALGIGTETVRTYLSRAQTKLNAKTPTQAAVEAVRLRLIR